MLFFQNKEPLTLHTKYACHMNGDGNGRSTLIKLHWLKRQFKFWWICICQFIWHLSINFSVCDGHCLLHSARLTILFMKWIRRIWIWIWFVPKISAEQLKIVYCIYNVQQSFGELWIIENYKVITQNTLMDWSPTLRMLFIESINVHLRFKENGMVPFQSTDMQPVALAVLLRSSINYYTIQFTSPKDYYYFDLHINYKLDAWRAHHIAHLRELKPKGVARNIGTKHGALCVAV